jgi:hypothetical protein
MIISLKIGYRKIEKLLRTITQRTDQKRERNYGKTEQN